MKQARTVRAPISLIARLVHIHQTTLALALAVVTLLVILLAVVYEFRKLVDDGQVQARMLADHVNASLLFNDIPAAEDVLKTLRHAGNVESAAVYDKNHRLFARYADTEHGLPGTLVADQDMVTIQFHHISLMQPVMVGGEEHGTVLLVIRLTPLYQQLLYLLLFVVATATLAVFLTRQWISRLSVQALRPLVGMTEVMQQVSDQADYGLRTQASDIVELDQLSRGFNAMLARIQSQDEALRHAQDHLEAQVDERTRQLQQAKESAENASVELANSLSLVNATLEASDNGILVVNRDDKVVYANRRFAEMWRVPAELLARGDDDKIRAHVMQQFDDPGQFLREVEALYAQPEAVSRDTLEFRDGRVFARFSHPQVLSGEIVGRVWSFLDITEQQRSEQRVLQLSRAITEELERSEQQRVQLQTLLSAIPDLVWMKDPDGVFLSCNPAFGKLIGTEPAEALGKTDHDFFPAEVAQAFRADDQAVASLPTPLVREEWVSYPGDGHRALLETAKAAVRSQDGKLIGVLGIARDITRARALLEELELARREAMQSNEAKSMFLASMSHELRTPLNAIIGFAQMLQLGVPAALEASQQEAVGHILGSGRHLLSLINEVLDLTRIEAGKLDLDIADVALAPVLAEAVTLTGNAAAGRRIGIRNTCPTTLWARADAARVRQILLNLLSNAVKYNRDDGQVAVSCQVRGEYVRINVVDSGPGIPAARHAELFQPFQRLGAERTATEGTGIGLVVCKKLVEAMHGQIGFESEVGIGSRFWVELPLARPALAPATVPVVTPLHAGSAPVRGRVLYVEDNPVNLAIMESIFEHMLDAELLTAESAELGLELIHANPPDLVLMDINLPGMSGLEALKQIRADPRTANLAVVAVSAAAMPQDVQQGLDAGFLAYLTKPFDIPELVALVTRALQPAKRLAETERDPA